MKWHLENKKTFYLVYSVLFVLLFFFCFEIYLLRYHLSILWKADPFEMHYIQFLYLGRWIRTGIATGEFPLWDPSIGYGADFLAGGISLLCDPLNWLSVVLPERFAEAGFHFLTAFRLYLCGLTFSWFALKHKLEPYAVLCGSIIYTFCAFSYTCICQSGFMLAMYMLPLLLVGTDELFDHNRSVLYVLSLSYCGLVSFYLTYMLAILIIAYCILKWCFLKKEGRTIRSFFRLVGCFLLYSVWSAAIAAAALLPAAFAISGMGRLELTPYVPIFYDKLFYSSVFKALISSYNMLQRDSQIGFSVLALVCVFAFLLTEPRKNLKLKIVFITMAVGLCIPFVGHVMNGFSYIANRWVWAFCFVVGYLCAVTIPELKSLKKQIRLIIFLCCIAYVAIAYIVFSASGRAFQVLSFTLIVVSSALFIFPYLSDRQYQRCLVFLSCVTVILPAFFQYSRNYINDFRENIAAGSAYETALQSNGMPLLNQIDTSDGTRYNAYGLKTVRNASRLYGVSGMDLYDNIYNSNIDAFHNSIALHTDFINFSYEGLDRRSELLALLGVNHFFTTSDQSCLPVGFDSMEAQTISGGKEILSYKPKKDNSLFTLFKNVISYEDYNSLSPYERQQALMQACVVDTHSANTSSRNLKIEDNELLWDIKTSSGLKMQENAIVVSERNGELSLALPAQESGELYLYFDNIVFDSDSATTCTIKIEAYSGNNKLDDMTQTLTVGTKLHHMYGGRHNWLLNLGTVQEPVDTILITFRNPGNYTFNAIKVYNRPLSSIIDNIEALKHKVDDISFAADSFSLSVTAEQTEHLFAAIPFDKGWRAYDNGKPIDIQRADVGFMSVELTPGEHVIVFQYHNQSLVLGIIISLIALFSYSVVEVIINKKNTSRFEGI